MRGKCIENKSWEGSEGKGLSETWWGVEEKEGNRIRGKREEKKNKGKKEKMKERKTGRETIK